MNHFKPSRREQVHRYLQSCMIQSLNMASCSLRIANLRLSLGSRIHLVILSQEAARMSEEHGHIWNLPSATIKVRQCMHFGPKFIETTQAHILVLVNCSISDYTEKHLPYFNNSFSRHREPKILLSFWPVSSRYMPTWAPVMRPQFDLHCGGLYMSWTRLVRGRMYA